jgi:hypothetical protein
MGRWALVRTGRGGGVFTAVYKQKILAEYEALDEPGAKGALLRREACTPRTWWSGGGLETPAPRPAWLVLGGRPSAAGRRSRTSSFGATSSVWTGSWPRPARRWRSWEKQTRSWNCSPRARTPTGRRSRDRPGRCRAGRADLHRTGVRVAGQATGQSLPRPAATGAAATLSAAAAAERPDRTPNGSGSWRWSTGPCFVTRASRRPGRRCARTAPRRTVMLGELAHAELHGSATITLRDSRLSRTAGSTEATSAIRRARHDRIGGTGPTPATSTARSTYAPCTDSSTAQAWSSRI